MGTKGKGTALVRGARGTIRSVPCQSYIACSLLLCFGYRLSLRADARVCLPRHDPRGGQVCAQGPAPCSLLLCVGYRHRCGLTRVLPAPPALTFVRKERVHRHLKSARAIRHRQGASNSVRERKDN